LKKRARREQRRIRNGKVLSKAQPKVDKRTKWSRIDPTNQTTAFEPGGAADLIRTKAYLKKRASIWARGGEDGASRDNARSKRSGTKVWSLSPIDAQKKKSNGKGARKRTSKKTPTVKNKDLKRRVRG